MKIRFSEEEFARLKNLLRIYAWGQQTLLTKLNIMHEDFRHFQDNNPIEHIKGRIKAPESIAQKLHNKGVALTAENAKKHLKDIAGVRIICPFAKDIYQLAELLRSMPDVNILAEKDYVSAPKPSGYRSYHIVMEIPVFYSGKAENVVVEVQLRTEAMNFWSTLEHKARYKYHNHIPQHLCDELVICASKIAELDERMFLIHEIISLINGEGEVPLPRISAHISH
ncbi:MAG: GTP pyrophosphokinase family protein [Oscillospiraceae bacterium]|nr:GTP pyrophosphokinase family protein [Oscillospiraceae bacterium]